MWNYKKIEHMLASRQTKCAGPLGLLTQTDKFGLVIVLVSAG
jgi:hypothetical protein